MLITLFTFFFRSQFGGLVFCCIFVQETFKVVVMNTIDFTPHGVYTVSNAISYLVELSNCGEQARMLVGKKVTDWYEVEFIYDEDSEDTIGVIDPKGYNVPLNLVMRLERIIGDEFKCVICEQNSVGYGNNPAPVKDKGKCCDDCNHKKVIPARLEQISFNHKNK